MLGDFAFRDGRVILRKTGNSAAIDLRLVREVAGWLVYHLIVRVAALRHFGRARPSLWFTPDVPHPRYMVRTAAIWAGIRIARSPAEAEASFFFEDATRSPPPPPPGHRAFNFRCTDISKSRVAATFEHVFGYALAIDPRAWTGDAVEKSEENGRHDGRITICPTDPRPAKVYQRLIDTIDADGLACDLRTHCIGGRVVAVWRKRRLPEARFLPPNRIVSSHAPNEIFSAAECALIERFLGEMGADWCGLDILRDSDGRIYIVDVNKTDAGPITALPLREKLAATSLLAHALRAMVFAGVPLCPPST